MEPHLARPEPGSDSAGVAMERSSPLVQNALGRAQRDLGGAWKVIVDPYENGYYDYRYQLHTVDGYFTNRKPTSKSDLVEFDFDRSGTLAVPADWNSQRCELLLYEGTVWYKTEFDAPSAGQRRWFLHFGAANYDAKVWVNGQPVGEHVGGFTAFDLEVTDQVVARDNFVVVKVDNTRHRDGVPTVNTDWWNYGGLTREVMLLEVPRTFIRDYVIQLARGDRRRLVGWVQLDGPAAQQEVTLRIPEAGVQARARSDAAGMARFDLPVELELWAPGRPRLYEVEVVSETDAVRDRIGFRTLDARGPEILLNGEPIFLRGISLHEQAPLREGRAYGPGDARTLLGWVRELGANFVRLAHYPHNEHMIRMADELGILVWAELPVYWTISWENPATLENACRQLREMIARDRNRASVAIWAVGNEAPATEPRTHFLSELARQARELDTTRLVSAALEQRSLGPSASMIDDPLGAQLDVLGCNEYLGWYLGPPERIDPMTWQTSYDKPLVMSEFGADALQGLRGDPRERWTEDYQADIYERQLRMLDRIPFLRGMTPWILTDFRSPRRPLAGIQDFWNRKGLISERGVRKQAFQVLQRYYARKAGG